MMYRVRVTEAAKQDVRQNLIWWSENRSEEQAARWFHGIYAMIDDLAHSADRQPAATEITLRLEGFRQAAFGLGRRPSHRIIFGIDGETIIVYRVRSLRQDEIDVQDLTD